MKFRNHLYDIEHKSVFNFETNVIAVGNLSMGGTGKTPLVEYLIRYLISQGYENKITTLSRGYGRKTKGFHIASELSNASQIGDEPYQIFQKFKESIQVTVGEDRVLAIPSIVYEFPENEIILLDDAYQQRSIKPNFSILLTDYNRPFYKDYVLPSGRLRESRSGAKRADAVIVTKCPKAISEDSKNEILEQIKAYTNKKVFFTTVTYDEVSPKSTVQNDMRKIILVTGIARADDFKKYLIQQGYHIVKHFEFSDHHLFNQKELDLIETEAIQNEAIIMTTEKDWSRLMAMPELSNDFQSRLFYIPIMVQFLDEENTFQQMLEESLSRAL